MPEHFNALSPAEAERLAFLIEECGEVIQAASKILRHGYDSFNPTLDADVSNRDRLTIELGQVRAAMYLLHTSGDINEHREKVATLTKIRSVRHGMHHQPET